MGEYVGLPARAAQYRAELDQAAAKHGLGVLLLAAIMERESRSGEALRPKGPGGTGDWAPRSKLPSQLVGRGVVAVGRDPERPERVLVMPADRLGWGRGLMQIDYAAHRDWLSTHDWRQPAVNISKGAAVLAEAMKAFGGEETAAIAAYNAGVQRVRDALGGLPPASGLARLAVLDGLTTGRDYVSDVLRRRVLYARPG